MKKLFWMSIIGAILVVTLDSPLTGRANPVDDKRQKERVKIVVVDKKGRPGGESQKPANEDRNRRP